MKNFPDSFEAIKSKMTDIKNGIEKNSESDNPAIPGLDGDAIQQMIDDMETTLRKQKLLKAELALLVQQKKALKNEANDLLRSAYDSIRSHFKRGNRMLELFGFKVHKHIRAKTKNENSGGESENNE